MAYEDNAVASQDEMDRPPTPEEIEAARLTEEANRAAIMGTVRDMKALESGLTQPAPPAATVTRPRNRIYMGPNIGDPLASPKEFFQDAPIGTRINRMPVPVLSPEEQTAVAHRIAMGTRTPPAPLMTGEQFAAQEGYRRAIESGIPSEVATRLYLPPLLKGQTATVIPPYQQAMLAQRDQALAERRRQFDALHPPTTGEGSRTPIVTPIGGGRSVVEVPGSKAWRMIDTSGEVKPFTAAQAAKLYQDITAQERFGRQTNSELTALKPGLLRIMQEGGVATTTGTNAPVVAPPGKTAAAAPARKEVVRLTKDNPPRRAVFDADTKKFLRYAD